MQRSYLDDYTFNSIKGIAVILLYILHFFASSFLWLPDFYLSKFLLFENYFQFSANLCVAIFAFLTGYGFWCSANKTLRHSCTKSIKVLRVYWIIYFTFFLIAVGCGLYYDFTLRKVILELFGLGDEVISGEIMPFCWYISFYIVTIFFLPFLNLFLERYRNIFRDVFYILILPFFLFSFIGSSIESMPGLKKLFVDLNLWFPSVGLGYITARYSLFEQLDSVIDSFCRNKNDKIRFEIIASIVFVIITICGMYYYPGLIYTSKSAFHFQFVLNMSVFYILIFNYAIIKLVNLITVSLVKLVLTELGKYSLYMWVLNGVFFNVFKEYTQPLLIYPYYAVLILIWGLLICFVLTKGFVLIESIIQGGMSRENN